MNAIDNARQLFAFAALLATRRREIQRLAEIRRAVRAAGMVH